MSDNLYTYGVVEGDAPELDVEGVNGSSPVRGVEHRPLAAIVTDVDELEPERTDENARAHDEVLRAVLREGRTVVPMQFGMVFGDARTLKSVLRGGRRAFTKALRDVDGKVEMGLKLIADPDATLDHEAVRDAVEGQLSELVDGQVDNELFSERLVLNQAYLVDRERREAFETTVETIAEGYGDALTVEDSGPWAPYNFVDIEIGAKQ